MLIPWRVTHIGWPKGYYHQVPCESVYRSHLGPILTAQKNISTKKDSAGVLVDGTCCPLAALILKNSSVSHVFFQQIIVKVTYC